MKPRRGKCSTFLVKHFLALFQNSMARYIGTLDPAFLDSFDCSKNTNPVLTEGHPFTVVHTFDMATPIIAALSPLWTDKIVRNTASFCIIIWGDTIVDAASFFSNLGHVKLENKRMNLNANA